MSYTKTDLAINGGPKAKKTPNIPFRPRTRVQRDPVVMTRDSRHRVFR